MAEGERKTQLIEVRTMEALQRKDVGLKPDLHERAFVCRPGFNPTSGKARDNTRLTNNSTPIDTATGSMAILRPLLKSGLCAARWTSNKINKEIRLGSSRSSLLACMSPHGRIAYGH
jgi:hypothetical protein